MGQAFKMLKEKAINPEYYLQQKVSFKAEDLMIMFEASPGKMLAGTRLNKYALAYLHICKYNIYIYAYNRESWSRTAFAKT
jgi:hypothetical protein